ncbi:hypothetical protein [Novosphingobium aromaticivorans]|uniref:hypothetical protein n=1 Tax=Novosphingobium aromaticivorans TaxID=48935 RepID=UPI00005DE238|nr:hypothetical protein [Novosphingobium aromaticivorans]
MASKGQRTLMKLVASCLIHFAITLVVLCLAAFVNGTGDFSQWGEGGRAMAALFIAMGNLIAMPLFYAGYPSSFRDDIADAMIEWAGGGDA